MQDIKIIVPLTIMLVVFKLLGYITWSWWWVFSPLLLAFAVGLFFFFSTLVALYVIVPALEEKEKED